MLGQHWVYEAKLFNPPPSVDRHTEGLRPVSLTRHLVTRLLGAAGQR